MTVSELINDISFWVEQSLQSFGTGLIEVLRVFVFQKSFLEAELPIAGFALLFWLLIITGIGTEVYKFHLYHSDPKYREKVDGERAEGNTQETPKSDKANDLWPVTRNFLLLMLALFGLMLLLTFIFNRIF